MENMKKDKDNENIFANIEVFDRVSLQILLSFTLALQVSALDKIDPLLFCSLAVNGRNSRFAGQILTWLLSGVCLGEAVMEGASEMLQWAKRHCSAKSM